jgi:hypothetical protein
MRKCLLVFLFVLIAAPVALPKKKKSKRRKKLPTVTFVSPIECKNNHGKWRWDIKTERAKPPATIPADHKITVAEVAAWEMPEDKVKSKSPRFGREKEWFQLTGKVVLVKAEEDGDLHIQLGDPEGESKFEVVVEVPLDNKVENSAWSNIRRTVFDWSTQEFPFTTKTGKKLKLTKNPVIRVVGRAFYDAVHQKVSTPNRRKDNPNVTVWEIHPRHEDGSGRRGRKQRPVRQ